MGEKKRSLKDLFFRFFDEHESPLEKKGKYIDWDYFLEYGNNELKIISRKTFIDLDQSGLGTEKILVLVSILRYMISNLIYIKKRKNIIPIVLNQLISID